MACLSKNDFRRKDQRIVYCERERERERERDPCITILGRNAVAITCSNPFSHLKVCQMKTVAYSQMFDHV